MLVEGATGLGKTHILRAWRQARAGEMLTFSATCQPGEPSGWPLLAALRHRREQIDWSWFPPQLSWLRPIQEAVQTADVVEEKRLENSIRHFTLMLAQRARQVIAFFLDDLHYACDGTWSTLAFLAHRSHVLPLLLVGSYQPDLLSGGARQVLRSLRRNEQLAVIQLHPFSQPETRQLAQQFFPPEALTLGFVELLYQTAEGNPLFTVELLKTIQESGQSPTSVAAASLQLPQSVEAVLNRRLKRLSDDSRRLLAVAAGLGRHFRFRALAGAVPDVTDRKILEEINRWLEHGLVQEQAEGYEFTHEQIRLAARVSQ